MFWGIRKRSVLVAGAAALAVAAPPLTPSATADAPMALSAGQAVFWTGIKFSKASVSSSAQCTPALCPTYPITLTPGAARLRVAIDHPSRENSFTVEVIDPNGAKAGSVATSNTFAGEALIAKPVGGTWKLRVIPTSVTDSGFRMRAKLERALPQAQATKVALLPNLKTVPPYEFGFIAPLNPLNAVYPPDTVNPPLDVAGVHPLSCAADELAPIAAGGGGATKCLRLTSGPMNVGSGPFEMLFDFTTDIAKGKVDPVLLQGPMRQRVHFSDGSSMERAAGTYSFHKTHAHFHTDQVLSYELFKVDDPSKSAIRLTGVGTKSGFCPADQLFGDWHSFTQLPPGSFGEGDSLAGGNCFSPEGGRIGLSVGWGDVYRWQRPGQYVEFGGQPDGLYVVRATADMYNHVLEENETDNASYSYIRVTGEKIDILERGQGTDPWDKTKIVFAGLGPSARELGGPTVYVNEAAPPAPVQVADTVLNREILPETGAVHGVILGGFVALTAALLVLRRRVAAAPVR